MCSQVTLSLSVCVCNQVILSLMMCVQEAAVMRSGRTGGWRPLRRIADRLTLVAFRSD